MKHNTPAQKAKSLGTLFFTFFKIGLFTFGGGYAMIALLEEEFIPVSYTHPEPTRH